MAKEKSYNPAQAQRKADKAKALKKSKAQVQAQRNEKLARRNPDRLQKQIDELKNAETDGTLRPRDKQYMEQLEKDVKAIRKAREALGDQAPQFKSRGDYNQDESREGRERGGGGVLGKRRRDNNGRRDGHDSSDTDEDVRDIPMPRDTPPPIPRPRRENRGNDNPNEIPLGNGPDGSQRVAHALPPKPVAKPVAQTTYESAPVIRDLRKEATEKFMPAAVQRKIALSKGQGRLIEPEEADRLEKEGYGAAAKAADAAIEEAQHLMMNAEKAAPTDLQSEEERFERELRQVEMEEVEDEDL